MIDILRIQGSYTLLESMRELTKQHAHNFGISIETDITDFDTYFWFNIVIHDSEKVITEVSSVKFFSEIVKDIRNTAPRYSVDELWFMYIVIIEKKTHDHEQINLEFTNEEIDLLSKHSISFGVQVVDIN